jgi:hypothetical protein
MSVESIVANDRLLKLMKEISSLRMQVEQAERDRATTRVEVASAIVATQARLQSRSGRSL